MRRFELSDGKSHKFWAVQVKGTDVHLHWGRIGTAGQQKVKPFGDADDAERERDKLISTKEKKGYVEVGGATEKKKTPATNKKTEKKTEKKKTPAANKNATEKKTAAKKVPAARKTTTAKKRKTAKKKKAVKWPDEERWDIPEEWHALTPFAAPLPKPSTEDVKAAWSRLATEWQGTTPSSVTMQRGPLEASYPGFDKAMAKPAAPPQRDVAFDAHLGVLSASVPGGGIEDAVTLWLRHDDGAHAVDCVFAFAPLTASFDNLQYWDGTAVRHLSRHLVPFIEEDPALVDAALRTHAAKSSENAYWAALLRRTDEDLLTELLTARRHAPWRKRFSRNLQDLLDASRFSEPVVEALLAEDGQRTVDGRGVAARAGRDVFLRLLRAQRLSGSFSSHIWFDEIAALEVGYEKPTSRDFKRYLKEQPRRTLRVLVPMLDNGYRAEDKVRVLLKKWPSILEHPDLGLSTEVIDQLRAYLPEAEPSEPIDLPPSLAVAPDGATSLPTDLLVEKLPVPTLLDGTPLPASARQNLCKLLAMSTPFTPHPSLAEVKQHCAANSLSAFSLGLAEEWNRMHNPSPHRWMFQQLAHFASPVVEDRVFEWFETFQEQSSPGLAGGCFPVLAATGTDRAALFLHQHSLGASHKLLQNRAQEAIAHLAASRGLSVEQMEDQLVPRLGLDDQGGLNLDFGPRQFRVLFDEHLRPVLFDGDGKVRKALPKPNRKDDARLAEAAKQQFSALKTQVKVVAKQQIARFEWAMVDGRSWTADDFQRWVIDHPLLVHLAQRLVWASANAAGQIQQTFRVAEDRTWANEADDAISSRGATHVVLPHPIVLPEALRQAWADTLSDYALLQPFAQLGRTLHSLPASLKKTKSWTALQEQERTPYALLALKKRGWRPVTDGDRYAQWMDKSLPSGRRIRLAFSPGFDITDPDEEQTLGSVQVFDKRGTARAFSSLTAVEYSELMLDLATLTDVA